MKNSILILLTLVLFSCGDDGQSESSLENKNEKESTEKFSEATIKRHIEGSLSIPATEKYSYEIFEANLDGDDSLDYVVTVNQLEKAIDAAVQSGNVAKRAEMGYMGKYNHFFYIDGRTKRITSPIPVASSPHGKLNVAFPQFRSDAFHDITVDYRIRNSMFRRYFTVINGVPMQVFETKIFDGLGTQNTEAYIINFDKGSYSLTKDILVYKGILEDISIQDPMSVYSIYPQIQETEELVRRWFFNDQSLKYYTEAD